MESIANAMVEMVKEGGPMAVWAIVAWQLFSLLKLVAGMLIGFGFLAKIASIIFSNEKVKKAWKEEGECVVPLLLCGAMLTAVGFVPVLVCVAA